VIAGVGPCLSSVLTCLLCHLLTSRVSTLNHQLSTLNSPLSTVTLSLRLPFRLLFSTDGRLIMSSYKPGVCKAFGGVLRTPAWDERAGTRIVYRTARRYVCVCVYVCVCWRGPLFCVFVDESVGESIEVCLGICLFLWLCLFVSLSLCLFVSSTTPYISPSIRWTAIRSALPRATTPPRPAGCGQGR